MLNHPRAESPPDPDDVLQGKCPGCSMVHRLPRHQARPPETRSQGWDSELWSCECPTFQGRWYQGKPVLCGAKVLLAKT